MRLLHAILDVLIGNEPRPRRVLVLGAGRSAWRIARIRHREERRRFTIVGYVPTAGDIGGTVPTNERIYLRSQYLEFCRSHAIDEIVVAMDDHRRGFPLHQVNACRSAGISIVGLGAFLGREGRGIRLRADAANNRPHGPLTHVD
jgi:hypothetical protein